MNYQNKQIKKMLSSLLGNSSGQVFRGEDDVEILGISHDSRMIKPGFLYAALPGRKHHGKEFIDKAILGGAVAVLSDCRIEGIEIPLILSKNPRKDLGIISHEFYGNPSREIKVLGVTGTNGKTTNVFILKSLLEALGEKVGIFSTLGIWVDEEHIPTTLGVPESPEVAKRMNLMVESGCGYCLLEATSMGVFQERLSGVTFEAGVFTNLTHDHIDDHGNFENYLQAKRAFLLEIPKNKPLIVNADDDNWVEITKGCESKIALFGTKKRETEYTFHFESFGVTSQKITIQKKGFEDFSFETSLIGGYNAYNVAGAAILIEKLFGRNALLDLVQKEAFSLLSIPGRLQEVANSAGIRLFVDYAHTPDALENVLKSMILIKDVKSKLICVFGCGGDRDDTKRPIMGEIATRLADTTIITSDNPRTENPEDILSQIKKGAKGDNNKEVFVVPHREEAIRKAIELAREEDIVLIAGKGHETYQEIKGVRYPFDDVEISKKFLTQADPAGKV